MILWFLVNCSGQPVTTHCYILCAFYLAHGDYNAARWQTDKIKNNYPPTGIVTDFYYNSNELYVPNLEINYEPAIDLSAAYRHLEQGHLVCIVYRSDGPSGFHSAPFWGQDDSDIGDAFERVDIVGLYYSFEVKE